MYNYCPNCGEKQIEDKGKITCKRCNRSFYNNSRPTASVIPIFNKEMLVHIRNQEPNKDKINIFGGFLEAGEHPEDGVIREFKEETNVLLKREDLDFLGIHMDEYLYQDTKYDILNIVYFVRLMKKPDITLSPEIKEYLWVPVDGVYDWAFKSINETMVELRKKLVLSS
jgi:NAD+ diphosphatase